MNLVRNRTLRWAALLAVGGTCFQISGCSVSGLGNFLSNLNPCGTVLNCDPMTFRFLTSGYQGPGVNIAVDPACTYPPFCTTGTDPFVQTTTTGP